MGIVFTGIENFSLNTIHARVNHLAPENYI